MNGGRGQEDEAVRSNGLDERLAASSERADAALAHIGTRTSLHVPSATARDPELVQIHAEAGRFFQACLRGSWVCGYLASRGLDAALLPTSPWKIGYAPASWTALTDHLRRLGHCDAALLCSGLVVNCRNGKLRDHFHDRLMIPLRAEDRIVVAFIGRRHPDTGDDRGPKYLNSPDTALFTKGAVLAGLAEARGSFRRGAQPVLVEGPLDAIAVSIAGPGQFAGVTPCGTSLTGQQAAALARTIDIRERGLRVALDSDPAGRRAAVRAYHHLATFTPELVSVAFPDGADPASVLQEHGPPALLDMLRKSTRPLADLVTDAAMDEWARGRELIFAELQLGALRAAAAVIATMPPAYVGPQAARLCSLYADRHSWDHEQVNAEIIAAIERRYESSPRTFRSPWAVVQRATAPSQSRAAVGDAGAGSRHLRVVPQSQYERG